MTGLATTRDVVGRLRDAALAAVLHEEAATPLGAAPLPEAGDVVLVVGPEGGISPEELAAFEAAGAGALSPRTDGAAHVHGGSGRRRRAALPHHPLALTRASSRVPRRGWPKGWLFVSRCGSQDYLTVKFFVSMWTGLPSLAETSNAVSS